MKPSCKLRKNNFLYLDAHYGKGIHSKSFIHNQVYWFYWKHQPIKSVPGASAWIYSQADSINSPTASYNQVNLCARLENANEKIPSSLLIRTLNRSSVETRAFFEPLFLLCAGAAQFVPIKPWCERELRFPPAGISNSSGWFQLRAENRAGSRVIRPQCLRAYFFRAPFSMPWMFSRVCVHECVQYKLFGINYWSCVPHAHLPQWGFLGLFSCTHPPQWDRG